MTKVLKRVNPLQLAKITAVTYCVFSLIFLLFALISMLFPSSSNKSPMGILLMVVLYPVFGFLGGLVFGAIYNVCAGWVGGIEFEVEDK